MPTPLHSLRSLARVLLTGFLVPVALALSVLGFSGSAGASSLERSPEGPAADAGSGTVAGWVGVNWTDQGDPKPTPGVVVSFYAQDDSGAWVESTSAVTDNGGNYSASLAPDSYKVRFHYDQNFAVEASWYDGPATGGFVDAGTSNEQDATVLDVVAGQSITKVSAGLVDASATSVTISGWVGLDSTAQGDPKPTPGIVVSFYWRNASGNYVEMASTLTNTGGNYSKVLRAGSYKVYFHKEKDVSVGPAWYNGSSAGGFVEHGTTKYQEATVIQVPAGGSIKQVSASLDLVDTSTATVSGWVGVDKTRQGEPFGTGSVEVSFYAQNDAGAWVEKASTLTRSGGPYQAVLEPDDYKVFFHYDKDPAVESAWYDGPVTGGFRDHGTPNEQDATVFTLTGGKAVGQVSVGLANPTAPDARPAILTGHVTRVDPATGTESDYANAKISVHAIDGDRLWPQTTVSTDSAGNYTAEVSTVSYSNFKVLIQDDSDAFVTDGWYAAGGQTVKDSANAASVHLTAAETTRLDDTKMVVTTEPNPDFAHLQGTVTNDVAIGTVTVDIFRAGNVGDDQVSTPVTSAQVHSDTTQGTWEAWVPKGSYKLRFTGDSVSTEWWQDQVRRLEASYVTVGTGGAAQVDAKLSKVAPLTISGHLTEVSALSADSFTGTLQERTVDSAGVVTWAFVKTVRVAQDGDYAFLLDHPGTYRAKFTSGGWNTPPVWIGNVGSARDATELTVTDQPVTGMDVVYDEDKLTEHVSGKLVLPGISSKSVYLRFVDVHDPGDRPDSRTYSIDTITSDGSYSIDLPAGDYWMWVGHDEQWLYYGKAPYSRREAQVLKVEAGRANVMPDFEVPKTVGLGLNPTNWDKKGELQAWWKDETGEFRKVDTPAWRMTVPPGVIKVAAVRPATATTPKTTYWFAGTGKGYVSSIDEAVEVEVPGPTAVFMDEVPTPGTTTG